MRCVSDLERSRPTYVQKAPIDRQRLGLSAFLSISVDFLPIRYFTPPVARVRGGAAAHQSPMMLEPRLCVAPRSRGSSDRFL